MDPERARLVNDILGEILEAPTADREGLLAQRCAGDPVLRAEVETLVRADAEAGNSLMPFMDEGALRALEGSPLADTRIGPYRLIREIGRGGMGLVYLAEREDEFRMRVAIKIVRTGFGDTLLRRFQHERQILANLDHPNIAKLLDGGTTPDGSPYLVMEHVDGEPITRYCESKQLPVAARLRLFQSVCAAVQYAHQHLVIHRDLKPVNILVTADGTPKLLDFGIAKLLEEEGALEGQTGTGFHPMTPAYASPEQVSEQVVTTSTDIYSLGVILFELLCGARPYAVTSSSPLEIQRAIVETTPPAPSSLKPDLSSDIDSIVSMALRKEPARRYVSAAALSDDIRRHLDNFPILGRSDSWSYRTGRFVRRNRTGVIAASLAAAALVAITIVAAWQAHEARVERAMAEKRFADARRIANSLVFELHDEIASVPGGTKARALLLRRGSEWLDALAVDAPRDPALGEELAGAYRKLGDALGGGAEANLGETSPSLVAYGKALALWEKLAAQAPDNPDRQLQLAATHTDMVYALEKGPEALAHAQSAVTIAQAVAAAKPGDPRRDRRLGQSFFAEGVARVGGGDLTGATPAFEKAAEIFGRRLAADPTNATAQRDVTLANKRLGAILAKQGRIPEALEHYHAALAVDEARAASDPGSFQARYDLSVSLVDLGWTTGVGGDWRGATVPYLRALEIREGLAKEDPKNALARSGLGSLLIRLGTALRLLDENRRALEYLARAEAVLVPGDTGRDKEQLAGARYQMAESWLNLGQPARAVSLARLALDGHRAQLSANPSNSLLVESIVWDEVVLGQALGNSQPAEACLAYREAARLATDLQAAGRLVGGSKAELLTTIDKGLTGCGDSREGGSKER